MHTAGFLLCRPDTPVAKQIAEGLLALGWLTPADQPGAWYWSVNGLQHLFLLELLIEDLSVQRESDLTEHFSHLDPSALEFWKACEQVIQPVYQFCCQPEFFNFIRSMTAAANSLSLGFDLEG